MPLHKREGPPGNFLCSASSWARASFFSFAAPTRVSDYRVLCKHLPAWLLLLLRTPFLACSCSSSLSKAKGLPTRPQLAPPCPGRRGSSFLSRRLAAGQALVGRGERSGAPRVLRAGRGRNSFGGSRQRLSWQGGREEGGRPTGEGGGGWFQQQVRAGVASYAPFPERPYFCRTSVGKEKIKNPYPANSPAPTSALC